MAATEAIDQHQLITDVVAPLSQINDALYDGISRMAMSSEYRPVRGGYSGVGNALGGLSLVTQLVDTVVAVVASLLGGGTNGE